MVCNHGFNHSCKHFAMLVVAGAIGTGFWGTMTRDARFMLSSYVLFILSVMRFASSKVSLSRISLDLVTANSY